MNKQDLKIHSDNELSLLVFNDEYLYRIRHRQHFKDLIDECFEYTDDQWQVLVDDLENDELVKNKIDGACLAECNSFEEIKEMGISMTVKAKLFYNKITDFKVNGVPLEYLHDSKAEKAKKEKLEAEERQKLAEEKAKKE